MRTILRTLLSGLCLLSFQVAVFSQQVAKQIPNSTSPDGRIGFLEFRPSDYGSQKHPLIIFLHGIGERGNGASEINNVAANAIPLFCSKGASMRFTVGGVTSSFVVLSPQLSIGYGYWPTYYVREMIKYAKANLQIDPDRIYITGLSLGGGGTWRAITDATGFDYTFDAGIAAAAPVCGTQEETDADFCKTIGDNHLPVWAFHSMDDGTVSVGATQHAEVLANMCGNISPAIKFTYYQSGGHAGAWINAFDTGHITRATIVNGNVVNFTANPNLYEWLLSNKRNTGTSAPSYTAPVANAGSAQIITLPLNTITLTGSGSGTNGATISSYSWTKTSGPSAGVISLPLLNTTLVTGLVQGTYVFTLTVTDNHGLTATSTVTITVNPLFVLNQPPIANAGGDVTLTLPNNATNLVGTGSSDPDGSIVKYAWTKTSGPSTYNIVNAALSSTWLTNLVQGVYVFTLTVTDNAGATSSSSLTVTVNAGSANQSPVAVAGSDVTLTLPNNATNLVGTGSSDPDGSIVKYAWTKTSGPSTYNIVNAALSSTWLTNLVQGVYVFTLTVTDNAGATSSSSLTVTVNAGSANQSPVAVAGSNVTLTLPNNATNLVGTGSSDPDGSIVKYAWTKTSGPSTYNIVNAALSSTWLTNLVQGVYVFTLTVTDNAGATSSSSLTVTVNAGSANQSPVAIAGSNVTLTLPNNATNLVGTGSNDPDGSIVKYAWTKTSGPSTYNIVNAALSSTWLTNLVQGVYVFTLTVTDNAGSTASSSLTVTVNPALSAPAGLPSVEQPIGYVKMSISAFSACSDASTDGRTPVYGSNIANGSILYADAAHTKPYNGGWNWFSFIPAPGAAVGQSFAIYPNGGINYLFSCATGSFAPAGTVITLPATTPPVVAPPPAPAAGNPIGYVKISSSAINACGDASSDGRTPVYGSSVDNGGILYTDAALTQPLAGGWNWYSFEPILGGTVTQSFAVYPNGVIFYSKPCSSYLRTIQGSAETPEDAEATLKRLRDSAAAAVLPYRQIKLNLYPNPVHTTATVEFSSDDNTIKIVSLYSASGVLKAKYTWTATKGKNVFSLQNVAGLANGLYIIEIRDSNGTSTDKLKFIKM